MKVLEIGGKKISCNIINKKVRHIYLRLKPDFCLEVILPFKSNLDIDALLKKKRRWLEEKVKELSNTMKILDDNRMLYRGNLLSVKVYSAKKPCKGIRLYDRVIFVYENPQKRKDEILKNFMANQTLSYVQEKAKKFAKDLGLTYSNIFIKDMRKWGQCTKEKNLSFNWRLIGLPKRLIDYIVFHEVLHLKYFSHSKQFKKYLAKYFINYKEIHTMLKHYSVF